jgi:hypothetical protein
MTSGIARCTIAVGLAALALLGGCTSIELGLGLRTRLDKLAVTSVSASLLPARGLVPGTSAALVIVATTADGKRLSSAGAGKGTVLIDSFVFDTRIATVDKKGLVSLPADPRLSEHDVPHVHITVVGHPDIVADLDIPVRYDANFDAAFSGAPGRSGMSGFDGLAGTDGAPGSLDPNNPSAGGNGSDGGAGSDGFPGSDGQPGPDVHVWLTLTQGTRPLLQARVAGAGREQFFLVDPAAGSLTVEANGGSGGRGGPGGSGGRGGSGGIGSPNGSSGRNGSDGMSGANGRDGAPGTIVVSVDPSASAYLDRIHLSNRGGSGAAGPAPQIQVEPVAPLW